MYTGLASPGAPAGAAAPHTVSGWLAAVAAGADVRALLSAARARCAALPASTWIHAVSDEQFAAQLDALDARRLDHADPAALLRALPLFGVPFAVKDNIDIAGVPTTAACPAFAFVPPATATVVARLQAAGAVWLGKTNLDQFATGLVGARSPFGRPASVFSAAHVSGGSSSGSAVAVAAGAVAFSLGTDTAGSGRVPAGFNQIVGLKPTPGRVSTAGVLPACRTLDCVSIFAASVADAAHVLAVAEGPDPRDDYSRFVPGPADWPTAGLRVGVPVSPTLDAAYAGPWAQALQRLAALGHTVVPLDFTPLHDVAALLYAGPWVAERHAVVQSLMTEQPDALDPVVRQVISGALSHTATDTFRAMYALQGLKARAEALWADVDLLLVPTAPEHPTFEALDADPVGRNSALGRYTNFVNLLGWCALALPSGTTAGGMPFGVTFIAPGGHDAALAARAAAWEAATPLPPGLLPLPAAAPAPPLATPLRRPATEAVMPLAVVGAHLSGLPLNHQLTERRARRLAATTTAPRYRLHALPGTVPPKPGLVRCAAGEVGHPIAVEVWAVPVAHMGSFLAGVAAPLGLGSVELADGTWVHGFLCESHALAGAPDISAHGGWRAYLASRGTA